MERLSRKWSNRKPLGIPTLNYPYELDEGLDWFSYYVEDVSGATSNAEIVMLQ